MELQKLYPILLLLILAGCAPSSYLGNIPSGEDGKAMSQYGDTPPTSFAYPLSDGYYFISTNEYSDVVSITIRLSKKSNVKLMSGETLIGNNLNKLHNFIFPPLEYRKPINPDCGLAKYLGCNNFYTYTSWIKLENNTNAKIPKNKGDKIVIVAPEVNINGKVFIPKVVTFIRKKDTYLSPLNS